MTWRESVRTWWCRRRDLYRELVRLQGVEAMLRVRLRSTEEARDAARRERDAAVAAADRIGKALANRNEVLTEVRRVLADGSERPEVIVARAIQVVMRGPEVTDRG